MPDDIHKKLKARAATAGMSMSDYILRDLKKHAEEPTMEEWIAKLRKLRPIKTRETSEQAVRAIRDSR
jgi:plasmid stability protein